MYLPRADADAVSPHLSSSSPSPPRGDGTITWVRHTYFLASYAQATPTSDTPWPISCTTHSEPVALGSDFTMRDFFFHPAAAVAGELASWQISNDGLHTQITARRMPPAVPALPTPTVS